MEIEDGRCDICRDEGGSKSTSISKRKPCSLSVCTDCQVSHKKQKGRGHTVIRRDNEVALKPGKRRRFL